MKKLILASVSLAVMIVGPAIAADMPLKAPVYAPPAVPILGWTGFYGGVNAGYSWSSNSVNTVGDPGPCTSPSPGCTVPPNYSVTSAQAASFGAPSSRNGFVGGGQIGVNKELATSLVAGLEADIQSFTSSNGSSTLVSSTQNPNFVGFPVNQTATVSTKLDYLGTVRGRVGFLVVPSFLAYATGGLAYGEANASTSIGQNLISLGVAPYSGAGTISGTRVGWTVGGGFEWMFAQNWSVKAEYLYVDLGSVIYNVSPLVSPLAGTIFSSATASSSVHFNDNIVRAGLNYHL
jgi:outer membrane immunogenic protein